MVRGGIDPVESTAYDVTTADGTVVAVSDLVTPAFFAALVPDARHDCCEVLTAPFSLTQGGYALVNNAEVFGADYPDWRRMTKTSEASRTYRRLHHIRRARGAHDHDALGICDA